MTAAAKLASRKAPGTKAPQVVDCSGSSEAFADTLLPTKKADPANGTGL